MGQRVWSLRVPVQNVNNAVPGARRLHTANCLDDKMIIYGGGTDRPFDSDVWILDASQFPTLKWEKAPMKNLGQGPNVRMGHTSVLDQNKQKIYIFGGWSGSNSGDTNIYVLDYQNWAWSRVTAAGFTNGDTGAEPSPSDNNNGDNSTTGNGDTNGSKIAVIVGSAVGAAAAVALGVAAIILFCCLRRRRRRQYQEKEQQEEEEEKKKDEKTLRNIPNGNGYAKHNDNNNNNNNNNNNGEDDVESKIQPHNSNLPLRTATTNSAEYSNNSSRGSFSAAAIAGVPSLMLSELGATTGGSSTGSSSPRQQGFFVQTPNEIHTQKPNEFTRPLPQRSINSSMLASTGISPISPSDQYTFPTTFRSSVSSSVPLAQLASPQQQSPTSTVGGGMTTPIDIYESVSPLEMLATLGRLDEEQNHYPEQNNNHQQSEEEGKERNVEIETSEQWQQLLPSKDTLLPRQPIVGHANSIYFAMMDDNTKPVVIKSCGRREAWERECRALNKLKSDHVVEVLQMLNNDSTHLAVLEFLEESLQLIMKQQQQQQQQQHYGDDRNQLTNSSVRKMIAKSIISCLAWTHSKGNLIIIIILIKLRG